MDWLVIHTGCFAVSNAISKTSPALRGFIREVRESRSELDDVLAEISSLDGVVDILKDDAISFPPSLIGRTPALLNHCTTIVNQLEGYMHVCNGLGLSGREKKYRWMAIRQDLVKLKATLEGYKSTLGLASDLVGLTKTPKENDKHSVDGNGERLDDAAENQVANHADMKHELTRVMADMGGLRARLQVEFRNMYAVSDLKSYLDAMQLYATDLGLKLDTEQRGDQHKRDGSGSSVGDGPDSAIDMDEPHSPVSPTRTSKETISCEMTVPIVEVEEFLDELRDLPAQNCRAPTPPPKAVARTASVRSTALLPFAAAPAPSIRSVSDYGTEMVDGEPVVPRRVSSLRSLDVPGSETGHSGTAESICSNATAIPTPLVTVIGHETRDSVDSCAPPPIRDNRVSRLFGRRSSLISIPGKQTRPQTSHSQTATTGLTPTMTFTSAAPASKESLDTVGTRPSTSLSTNTSSGGLSIRSISSARRLSNAFRKVSLWSPKATDTVVEDPEPDSVFGVSLKKSMQIASTTVRTHHTGSGSSKREFPRCILSCTSFIKESGGVEAPHIFGEAGNLVRVAVLREAFANGPKYGDGIDWADFDVYDAAELIYLFLQQLPKPLISETVAKRWIKLSKQATLPGSLGMRLDSPIDFWDEALLGVRGAARSLFKLLLNLWGDIAEAADRNDMTAERLAGRLLNPLMHLSASKYSTDYMLGLAFLIRKRSEYTLMLKGTGEKSKAAFESSGGG